MNVCMFVCLWALDLFIACVCIAFESSWLYGSTSFDAQSHTYKHKQKHIINIKLALLKVNKGLLFFSLLFRFLMVLARRPSKHWKQAHLHKIHWFFVHSLLLHHRMAFFTSVRHIGKRYCCCTFHSVFPFFILFLFSTLVLHKYYRLCAECTQFSKWIEATRWHWNKESSFIAIYNATH